MIPFTFESGDPGGLETKTMPANPLVNKFCLKFIVVVAQITSDYKNLIAVEDEFRHCVPLDQ